MNRITPLSRRWCAAAVVISAVVSCGGAPVHRHAAMRPKAAISVRATRSAGGRSPRSKTGLTGDRVLAIDDEPRVLDFISRALRGEGIDVDTAISGEDGFRLAIERSYDVIILDLLMPGTDGVSVLHRILRRKPGQSVIILSCLTDTTSKVQCLEMGADDYLAKPFALDELLARVKARMRDKAPQNPHILTTRRLMLDPVRQEANGGSGPVPLTRRESMLLAELMQNAGRAVSKERLLSAVWGYGFSPGSNVVDVYVRRLRAKLFPDAIVTVRGMGYGVDLD
jgi:two-component system OmpR family response regulator